MPSDGGEFYKADVQRRASEIHGLLSAAEGEWTAAMDDTAHGQQTAENAAKLTIDALKAALRSYLGVFREDEPTQRRIAVLCVERHLTPLELARKSGVEIQALERPDGRVRTRQAARLAEALEVPLEIVLGPPAEHVSELRGIRSRLRWAETAKFYRASSADALYRSIFAPNVSLALRVTTMRAMYGWSNHQLALAASVKQLAIWEVEGGKLPRSIDSIIVGIAAGMGIPASVFWDAPEMQLYAGWRKVREDRQNKNEAAIKYLDPFLPKTLSLLEVFDRILQVTNPVPPEYVEQLYGLAKGVAGTTLEERHRVKDTLAGQARILSDVLYVPANWLLDRIMNAPYLPVIGQTESGERDVS